jgi:hypothetical protein
LKFLDKCAQRGKTVPEILVVLTDEHWLFEKHVAA